MRNEAKETRWPTFCYAGFVSSLVHHASYSVLRILCSPTCTINTTQSDTELLPPAVKGLVWKSGANSQLAGQSAAPRSGTSYMLSHLVGHLL